MARPRQSRPGLGSGTRRPRRVLPAPSPSPLAAEIVGALKVLARPVPLAELAAALSRSESVVRAELAQLPAAGFVVRLEAGAVSLARYPGQVRLCRECHRPLRTSNLDPAGICDPCRIRLRDEAARSAEAMADDHRLRLMVLIRLAVQWGDIVDLAAYFETTDRRRIHRVVAWWRDRGAIIDGMPGRGYKLIDWRDAATGAAR